MIVDTRDARRALSATSPVNLRYMRSIYDDAPPWKEDEEDDAKGIVFTDDMAKLRAYNAEDCVAQARVWQGLIAEEQWNTPRVQRLYTLHVGLSRIAADMYQVGLPVDVKRRAELAQELEDLYDQREKKVRELVSVAGWRCTPNDMRALLYKRHENAKVRRFSLPDPVDPNMWVKKKMETIAVDQPALLMLIADPDTPPEVRAIVDAYWQAEGAWKARATYVVSEKVEQAIGDDNHIRAGWNSCGTDTGRFSCSSPNLMNLSEKKDEEGGALVGDLPNMRSMYWAGPGCVMIGADFSQLELRVMAAVSGDRVLEDALQTGDVYTADAIDCFSLPKHLRKCECADKRGKDKKGDAWCKENCIKSKPRKAAKIVHLAFQYNAGTPAIYMQALEQDRNIQFAFVRDVHRAMLKRYSGTVAYWRWEHERVRATGYSESRILQRRRVYPREPPPTETANFPIQATASDIVNTSQLRIYNKFKKYVPRSKLVIQLHDAHYAIAREKDARVTKEIIIEEMERPVTIEGKQHIIPVEAKVGTHWSQL